ncbi:MAG TPA: (2Fe-2S)-binding protein [Polyangiaceae bacterium]|nr:(2Fe-2S)-binding protein [Polyangiaceae bacterium]
MIVCHCRAVSDRAIRASIRDGATTIEAVCAVTGASGCCGGCEPMVSDILDEELGARPISSIGDRRPLRIVNDPRAA